VAAAFATIKSGAAEMGLKLNEAKCEVIPAAGAASQANMGLFPPSVKVVTSGCFELLGRPVGTPEFCNQHTAERVAKAKELLAAIGELPDPQVALMLLRHSASFGKLVYSTRVVPHRSHQAALTEFDAAVRQCFESFTSIRLADDSWHRATLTSGCGGVGLRSTAEHSAAAYIASRTSCHKLCTELDGQHVWEGAAPNTTLAQAATDFNQNVGPDDQLTVAAPDPLKQRLLSLAVDKRTASRLNDPAATSLCQRAYAALVCGSGDGQWLHAPPSQACGNQIEPELYGVMLERWLRNPLFDAESFCPFCDGIIDVYGDHCVTCCGGGDRTKRHNLLRNATYHVCAAAGLSPELEKPGLLRPRPHLGGVEEDGVRREGAQGPEGRRPADVYVPRWRSGAPAALDFAVTSGLRTDMLATTVLDAGAATARYEDLKNSFLDTKAHCQSEGITFIPMVVEANGGGWGADATRVWNELAKRTALATGESRSTAASQIQQRMSLILHRENARAVLRRRHAPAGGEERTAAMTAATASYAD